MNKRVGIRSAWVIGIALMGLSLGVLVSDQREAQASAALEKDVNKAVLKIAELIKKGDKAAAKAEAARVAKKHDMDEIMEAFKPRSKGGLGVGRTAGKIIPDGVELKLQSIARDAPAGTLAKEAAALDEMAYVIAAVAEIATAKAPATKGKQTKQDWLTWTKEMQEGAHGLVKAVKSGGAQEVKTLATKINNTCAACHAVFK